MNFGFIQNIIDVVRGKKTLKQQLLKCGYIRRFFGSYSQYGEDIILAGLLKGAKSGFYIDIGAHHPTDLNNTQYFYERGFRGINIEPNPKLIEEFFVQRPEDVNLNVGIASGESEMKFYVLEAATLSTFDEGAALDSCSKYNSKITEEIQVKTISLKNVIEEYANGKTIDFISVDAEGYDLIVLQSNDWQKYRPKLIMVEVNQDMDNILQFMFDNNYKVLYNNYTNCIFQDLYCA